MIIKNTDGVAMKVARAEGPRTRVEAPKSNKRRLAVLATQGDITYYWVRDELRTDLKWPKKVQPVRPYWVNIYNGLFNKWR